MGRKIGREGCALFLGGELGPNVTQCRLGRRLPPYLSTKWHLDPPSRLATIYVGRKLGAPLPFWRGALGPHLTQSRLG